MPSAYFRRYKMLPKLYIVVPCYNEQEVLPITSQIFVKKLEELSSSGEISEESRVLFVNDGSRDKTWDIIKELSESNKWVEGISLSRNRGHQNALLGGLMYAKDRCDITVSIDADGQDDVNAINEMVKEYKNGCEIVYGVRAARKTDTFFKRTTAEGFYKFMRFMGAEVVYNHADYRLLSSRALDELANFKEVNIFLRGMVPLVGFKSTSVFYDRNERMAGKSKYPLRKMLQLAWDGITSLSVKPIHIVMTLGLIVSVLGFAGCIWAFIIGLLGNETAGWASIVCIVTFLGGIQLLSIGIIGEYVGKIYLETKKRPRYIIEEETEHQ